MEECSSKIYFDNCINFLHGHLTAPPIQTAGQVTFPTQDRSPKVPSARLAAPKYPHAHPPPNTALYAKLCPIPNFTQKHCSEIFPLCFNIPNVSDCAEQWFGLQHLSFSLHYSALVFSEHQSIVMTAKR